jgi:hypothetical protein
MWEQFMNIFKKLQKFFMPLIMIDFSIKLFAFLLFVTFIFLSFNVIEPFEVKDKNKLNSCVERKRRIGKSLDKSLMECATKKEKYTSSESIPAKVGENDVGIEHSKIVQCVKDTREKNQCILEDQGICIKQATKDCMKKEGFTLIESNPIIMSDTQKRQIIDDRCQMKSKTPEGKFLDSHFECEKEGYMNTCMCKKLRTGNKNYWINRRDCMKEDDHLVLCQ